MGGGDCLSALCGALTLGLPGAGGQVLWQHLVPVFSPIRCLRLTSLAVTTDLIFLLVCLSSAASPTALSPHQLLSVSPHRSASAV